MAKANSTRGQSATKDFPLWFHAASGQWCKKIRQKRHYFGPDKQQALERYLRVRDDLLAGRTPQPLDAVTVEYTVNHFLTAKDHFLKNGELSPRSFADYRSTAQRMVRVLGRHQAVESLSPDHFRRLRADIAKTRGLVATGNEVNRVRIILRYAYEEGLINQPIRFGQSFQRPSKKAQRLAKVKQPKKLFSAGEVLMLIDAASVQMTAMIWLAINTGMGNHDVALISENVVDLDRGWMDYARHKTGVGRTAPLWPETVAALRAARAARPKPKNPRHHDLFFITKYGKRWATDDGSDGPIAKEFRKLLDETELHLKGRGFYGLRHTFQTIAERCKDFPAIRHVMGHAQNDMSSEYREEYEAERLQAVTDTVRSWLLDGGAQL